MQFILFCVEDKGLLIVHTAAVGLMMQGVMASIAMVLT